MSNGLVLYLMDKVTELHYQARKANDPELRALADELSDLIEQFRRLSCQ
jgi:hypothetical protein